MARNDPIRNRRHKLEWKAEDKPDRKPVKRPEWLMEKGLGLDIAWVSPDGIP